MRKGILLIAILFASWLFFRLLRYIPKETPESVKTTLIVRDTVVITKVETVKIAQKCNCRMRAIGCDTLIVDYSARQGISYFDWFGWENIRSLNFEQRITYSRLHISPILGILRAERYKPFVGLQIERRGGIFGGFISVDRRNWGIYTGFSF